MARTRSVSFGLFENEDLAELSIFHRYAFVGLWTIADREGRIEDRPRKIGAKLFPYDGKANAMDGVLSDLERLGFLRRYEVDGVRVVQIVNFLKHQRPHPKEKDSELPPEQLRSNSKMPGKGSAFRDTVSTKAEPEPGKGAATPDQGPATPDQGPAMPGKAGEFPSLPSEISEISKISEYSEDNNAREATAPVAAAASPEPETDTGLTYVNGKPIAHDSEWVKPYRTAWARRFGGQVDGGKLVGHLGPLRESFRDDELGARWERYLASIEPGQERYASPKRFAEIHGSFSADSLASSTRASPRAKRFRSSSSENSENIRKFLAEGGLSMEDL